MEMIFDYVLFEIFSIILLTINSVIDFCMVRKWIQINFRLNEIYNIHWTQLYMFNTYKNTQQRPH